MENNIKIFRYWKNGNIDEFTIDELQKRIIKPISPPFEQIKYEHLKINGKEVYNNLDCEPLPGEYFESIDRFNIGVSNFSRIRNVDKIIIKQEENFPTKKFGQKYLTVFIDNLSIPTHQLVAEVFFIKENSELNIHHISGNALDNRPINLLYVSWENHSEIEPKYEILNAQISEQLLMNDWENDLLNEPGINIINNIEIEIDNVFSDFSIKLLNLYQIYILLNILVVATIE